MGRDETKWHSHILAEKKYGIHGSFICDLVERTYCHDNARPSIDLVILIKIPSIQYLHGIRNMRSFLTGLFGSCSDGNSCSDTSEHVYLISKS